MRITPYRGTPHGHWIRICRIRISDPGSCGHVAQHAAWIWIKAVWKQSGLQRNSKTCIEFGSRAPCAAPQWQFVKYSQVRRFAIPKVCWSISRADLGMGRSGPGPSPLFWQPNYANSTLFRVISAIRPPLFTNLDTWSPLFTNPASAPVYNCNFYGTKCDSTAPNEAVVSAIISAVIDCRKYRLSEYSRNGSVHFRVFFTGVWHIFSRDFGDKLAFHSQTEEVEWLLSLISTLFDVITSLQGIFTCLL